MNTKYTPDRKRESYVSDLFPLYILAFRMSKDAAVAKEHIAAYGERSPVCRSPGNPQFPRCRVLLVML